MFYCIPVKHDNTIHDPNGVVMLDSGVACREPCRLQVCNRQNRALCTLLAMTLTIECCAQAQWEALDPQDLQDCKDLRACKGCKDGRGCKEPQVFPSLPNISRPLCWALGRAVLRRTHRACKVAIVHTGPLYAQSTGPQGLQGSSAHIPT